MSAGCALAPADRYSTKMASEGASGEQPPPVQTLATAVLGSVDTVRHGERLLLLLLGAEKAKKCRAHLYGATAVTMSGEKQGLRCRVTQKCDSHIRQLFYHILT